MNVVRCLTVAMAMLVASFVATGRADTLAVTPNLHCTQLVCEAGGIANGAMGFSFVPTTNIVVMQMGFWPFSNADPRITVYADTNLIATYFPPPNTNANVVVYTDIAPLCLTGGQRYSVFLQNGVLSNSTAIIEGWVNRAIAPEIASYNVEGIGKDGTWTNSGPDFFMLGADFYYVVPPVNLSVAVSGTNAWVTFPAYSNELYDVQHSSVLTPESWSTIATNLTGPCGVVRQIDTGAATATNQFYRLRIHF